MKATIASIMLLLATVANAGPFGYEMGQKIEGEPDGVTSRGVSYKTAESAPNPFDSLIVYYTAQHGLCGVTGVIGIDAGSDSYGNQHRDKADWLAKQVEAKYGKPTNKFDFLKAGSIWHESRYWLTAINKNERSYAYFWTEPPYSDEVTGIVVEVTFGWVLLIYDFANVSQCISDAENQLQNTL